jgi:uncharacterized membrane protein
VRRITVVVGRPGFYAGGMRIFLQLADTWGMHDVGGGWWVLMMLGMLLFWAVLIGLVVWLVRGGLPRLGGGGDGGAAGGDAQRRETALELLDRRLADGTITPEEYRERRARLTGDPPARVAAS